MRILLATHHLVTLGGTEMWTRVMFDELSSDHQVDVYSVVGNTLWPEMPPFDPTAKYDLALINHNRTMLALRHARIRRRIMVLHGILPALEWPVLGADAYVAVAEDIRQFVPVPTVVIGNPIEIHRYAPRRPVSDQLRRVAFLSNYESPASRLLAAACTLGGLDLRMAGLVNREGTLDHPEDLMDWADLVVGVGRTALEGMSAGRNVFTLGTQGSSGMVTDESVHRLSFTNFAPKPTAAWPQPDELARQLLDGYDSSRSMREYVHQHHDPSEIAARYLELGRSISPRQRILSAAVRRAPRALMTARAMTVLDGAMREVRRQPPSDGRPAVLSPFMA